MKPWQKPSGARFTLGCISIAVLLSIVYTGALNHWKKTASFGENSLQSNLIRLEEYTRRGTAKVTLLGSSMAARLLPPYFEPLALDNVAIDGSSAAYGLKSMLGKKRLATEVCLIEINTLARHEGENEAMLDEAMKEPQRYAAQWLPILRPGYRPSSVLYSAFKLGMDESDGAAEAQFAVKTPILIRANEGIRNVSSVLGIQRAESEMLEKVHPMIARLMERGVKVIFFVIPTLADGQGAQDLYPLARELLSRFPGTAFVDVSVELERIGYRPSFSDKVHLTPQSARMVALVLEQAVFAQERLPKGTQ